MYLLANPNFSLPPDVTEFHLPDDEYLLLKLLDETRIQAEDSEFTLDRESGVRHMALDMAKEMRDEIDREYMYATMEWMAQEIARKTVIDVSRR